jgi:hypothetical protein
VFLWIFGTIIIGRCILSTFAEETERTVSEYIFQAMLLTIIIIIFATFKIGKSLKPMIHTIAVPFLLLIVIKKHLDMTGEKFQMSECFCTFSLIMVFSSLNSPLKYYTVQFINVSCFSTFYFVMLLRFGFYHIKWDFYHNLIVSLALIAFIHRQKEGLLRSNYINNSVY